MGSCPEKGLNTSDLRRPNSETLPTEVPSIFNTIRNLVPEYREADGAVYSEMGVSENRGP